MTIGIRAGSPHANTVRLRIAMAYDARYPDHHGGAERRYHEIASRLARTHEVEYITWRHPGDVPAASAGYRVRNVGLAPPLYGTDGKRTVREAVKFAARIVPILIQGRYDVIDCSATPYVPLYASWLASRIARVPLVVTWHEFWGNHWLTYLPHRPMVARVARRMEASALHIGDRLVPVSRHTARRMGISDDNPRVRIVGNGVDVGDIRSAAPQPRSDVVYVGRLIDEKRVDLLLRALREVSQSFPQLTCVVIGDGPERGTLEALSADLGLADRVRFTGSIDSREVYGHLKTARAMVLPSVREGFGIAVLEAQAAGAVPIVVRSPASAAPELVDDGLDGLVCEPSPESLAAAISQLLSDRTRRTAMARRARHAAELRDWSSVADQMEQVYREAALSVWPIRRGRQVSPSCP